MSPEEAVKRVVEVVGAPAGDLRAWLIAGHPGYWYVTHSEPAANQRAYSVRTRDGHVDVHDGTRAAGVNLGLLG